MDAKLRANFINAVAGGEKIPCPECNTLNEADAKFCASCGKPLEAPAEKKEEVPVPTPFAPIKKMEEAKPVQEEPKKPKKAEKPVEVYVETESVFAEGLPDWDVVPPQVMVRRKRNK